MGWFIGFTLRLLYPRGNYRYLLTWRLGEMLSLCARLVEEMKRYTCRTSNQDSSKSLLVAYSLQRLQEYQQLTKHTELCWFKRNSKWRSGFPVRHILQFYFLRFQFSYKWASSVNQMLFRPPETALIKSEYGRYISDDLCYVQPVFEIFESWKDSSWNPVWEFYHMRSITNAQMLKEKR